MHGAVLTTVIIFRYELLQKTFPGQSTTATIQKVVCDQVQCY